MFGLFKKKPANESSREAAMRKEFDQTIAVARVAPLSKQARVGKGINDALADFHRHYTPKSFNELDFPEKKAYMDTLAKRQDELRLMGGDVSLEHIGYSLVSRWVLAVAMGSDYLVKHFDDNMVYFKRTAESL
jgi:hypothetical protein